MGQKLSKLTQEETETMNSLASIKEIEFIIKKPAHKKQPSKPRSIHW